MAAAMMKSPSGGSNKLYPSHSQDVPKVGSRTYTFAHASQTTENGVHSRPKSVSNFLISPGWLRQGACVITGYFIS